MSGAEPGTRRGSRALLGIVTQVCRVAELHLDDGPDGVTAIDKRPVDGPVQVGATGLRGDVQVSRKHHGGPDKALYALDQAEADHWAAELGREVEPGLFGENLRVAGMVDDAEIGERWRVGETLEVEVTGPRSPCATFAQWLGQDGWVKRYAQRGRPGVYLRVLVAGSVEAGAAISVLHRPGHGVSVARWFGASDPTDAGVLLAAEAAGTLSLAEYLRPYVLRAAGREAAAEPSGTTSGTTRSDA